MSTHEWWLFAAGVYAGVGIATVFVSGRWMVSEELLAPFFALIFGLVWPLMAVVWVMAVGQKKEK